VWRKENRKRSRQIKLLPKTTAISTLEKSSKIFLYRLNGSTGCKLIYYWEKKTGQVSRKVSKIVTMKEGR